MSFMQEYLSRCEREIADAKRDLEMLESGEMRLGERKMGTGWVDITPRAIEHAKHVISTYEAILARHQDGDNVQGDA